MTDRDTILSRLRANASATLAPASPAQSTTDRSKLENPTARLAEVLSSIGGRAIEIAASQLRGGLDRLANELAAVRVWVDIDGSSSAPYAIADLDLYVAAAGLAVAENAAIWVAPPDVDRRAALFLTQHLALVIERRAIIPDMHEAYAAIDIAAGGFGVFISGPSKTADIEQALVIGAHGPRSLTVFVVT